MLQKVILKALGCPTETSDAIKELSPREQELTDQALSDVAELLDRKGDFLAIEKEVFGMKNLLFWGKNGLKAVWQIPVKLKGKYGHWIVVTWRNHAEKREIVVLGFAYTSNGGTITPDDLKRAKKRYTILSGSE